MWDFYLTITNLLLAIPSLVPMLIVYQRQKKRAIQVPFFIYICFNILAFSFFVVENW
jgi:hypothetical protein